MKKSFRSRQVLRRRYQSVRPVLESLEFRKLLATFNAATSQELIDAIVSANADPGADTIKLTAGNYAFSNAYAETQSPDYGPNALPVISSNLNIVGNGATIQRSGGAPAFRLFDVNNSGALTLSNLTLANGLAQGGAGGDDGASYEGIGGAGGGLGAGGAIFSLGSLNLNGVTLTGNVARGGDGSAVAGTQGGGINGGAANGGEFGDGGNPNSPGNFGGGGGGTPGSQGGNFSPVQPGGFGGGDGGAGFYGGGGGGGGAAMGGAIFLSGSGTITNSTFTANSAIGGDGGAGGDFSASAGEGGDGLGGAIFNLNGKLVINTSTLSANTVTGGSGAVDGAADGGAVYNLAWGPTGIGGVPAATTTLTDSILANTNGSAHDLVNHVVGFNNGSNATVTSGGPNIVVSYLNVSSGTGGTATLNSSSFIAGVTNGNLGLAATLTDNSPNHPGTLALANNSPALFTGAYISTIQTDEVGNPRPLLPDLGAAQHAVGNYTITVNDTSDTTQNNPANVIAPDQGSNVNVLGSTITLRDAINAANNTGGHATIVLADTSYTFDAVDNYWYGPNALPAIAGNITIDGNGATLQRDSSLAQDTAHSFRFFYVSGGIPKQLPLGTLTLQDLTLTNGLAKGGNAFNGGGGMGAGGAIFNQGNVTLSGVTLTGNTALGGSGGLAGSGAFQAGGGIGQDSPSGQAAGGFGPGFPAGVYGGITPSSNAGGGGFVEGGERQKGGGLSGLGGAGFRGDGAGGDGGGSSASGLLGASFGFGGTNGEGSGGGVGGGGAYASGGGFGGGGGKVGSGGFGGGGGAYASGGFGGGNGGSDNGGGGGGGGAGLGGAVFSMYGTVNVINSTLTANTAQGGNGGENANGGSGFGGAIFNLDGTLNVTFSTIAYNSVIAGLKGTGTGNSNGSADGGGIYNLAYGNTYDTGEFVSATVKLTNSILAGTIGGTHDLVTHEVDGGNPANSGNAASVSGEGKNIVVSAFNAGFGGNGDSGLEDTTFLTGVTNDNLRLANTLANNGGPTQTLALLQGSPAVNVGSDVGGIATDQRGTGFARKIGSAADIGAFEYHYVESTVVTTTADEDDGTSDPSQGGGTSLREAIKWANSQAGDDVITFNLGGGTHVINLSGALPNLESNIDIQGTGARLLTVRRNTGGNYGIFQIESDSAVSISGLTISNGHTTDAGGGIHVNFGSLVIRDSVITGNSANANGGGIDANLAGSVTVINCLIANNTAGINGGGVFMLYKPLVLINSTISGNSAVGQGGGVNYVTARIVNSTITDNRDHSGGSAGTSGGGLYGGGQGILLNSIVASNFTGTGSTASDIGGGLVNTTDSHNNLIGTGGSGGLTNGSNDNQVGVADPGLNPLANNGGNTDTHALKPTSPALNKGNNDLATDQNNDPLPFDQRGDGFDRILSTTVDIGAFEGFVGATGLTTEYLSDLTPVSQANGWGNFENDHSNGENGNSDGHTITLNGITYAKGLGVHSDSDLRYALNGQDRFVADIGIDDEVGNNGNVIFQVFADGVKLYDSGAMTGASATQHVDVDISGRGQLRLVVLRNGNVKFDHADWADARLLTNGAPPPPSSPVALSSLTPTSQTNGWGKFEKDKSNGENGDNDGHTLTLNGVTYASGLGVHAGSDLRYALANNYTRFTADVGIDDEVGNNGNVIFQVFADGVKLFDSGVMTGSSITKHVDVDLTGKTELRLVVLSNGSVSFDHADWADAKLYGDSVPPPGSDSFISDMIPTQSTNGWGPVENNQSNGENAGNDGHTLTLNGTTYAKGLGVHSNSDVRYNIANTYSRFTADVGIDDEVGNNGNVIFQVFADGIKLFDSGAMNGSSSTQHVDVDIASRNELRLVVLSNGSVSFDHADWADAKVHV